MVNSIRKRESLGYVSSLSALFIEPPEHAASLTGKTPVKDYTKRANMISDQIHADPFNIAAVLINFVYFGEGICYPTKNDVIYQ